MAPVVALRWSDSPTLPPVAACLAVALLHVLLGAWLLQTGRLRMSNADEARISLRWLPPALLQPAAAPALPAATPAAPTVLRPSQRPAPVPAPPAELQRDTLATQVPLALGLPVGSIDGGDGISAAGVAPKLIGRREEHAAFAPRRNYFRIRRQMTPEQILEGVAQLLGTWPPGYMVDPCQLGKQDMAYFQGAVEDADRQALREAVRVVSERCR